MAILAAKIVSMIGLGLVTWLVSVSSYMCVINTFFIISVIVPHPKWKILITVSIDHDNEIHPIIMTKSRIKTMTKERAGQFCTLAMSFITITITPTSQDNCITTGGSSSTAGCPPRLAASDRKPAGGRKKHILTTLS